MATIVRRFEAPPTPLGHVRRPYRPGRSRARMSARQAAAPRTVASATEVTGLARPVPIERVLLVGHDGTETVAGPDLLGVAYLAVVRRLHPDLVVRLLAALGPEQHVLHPEPVHERVDLLVARPGEVGDEVLLAHVPGEQRMDVGAGPEQLVAAGAEHRLTADDVREPR